MKLRWKKPENYDYWKTPEKPYPKVIYWRVVAGNRELSPLEDHDVVFDDYDLKIRRIYENLKNTDV